MWLSWRWGRVGGRGSSAVDGIISPPAGESSGAARERFELSIMGFRTGLRLEAASSVFVFARLICVLGVLRFHEERPV